MNQSVTWDLGLEVNTEKQYRVGSVASDVSLLVDVLTIKNRWKLKTFLNQLAQGRKLWEVSATSVSHQKLWPIVVAMCQWIDIVPSEILDPLKVFLESRWSEDEEEKKGMFFQALWKILDSQSIRKVISGWTSSSIGETTNCVWEEVAAIKSYSIEDQWTWKEFKATRYIIFRADRSELARIPEEPVEFNYEGRTFLAYQSEGWSMKLFDCNKQRSILPGMDGYDEIVQKTLSILEPKNLWRLLNS